MPRVYSVKKARKDNPAVEKGQPYFWWKFRYGPKQYSATYPRPSQLTQSPFLSQALELAERIEDHGLGEDMAGEVDELRSMCEESLDNMPDGLRDSSPTGELLQERIDAMDEAESVFDNIEWDEEEEADDEARRLEEIEDAKEELLAILGSLP